jgi:hypothetical protein
VCSSDLENSDFNLYDFNIKNIINYTKKIIIQNKKSYLENEKKIIIEILNIKKKYFHKNIFLLIQQSLNKNNLKINNFVEKVDNINNIINNNNYNVDMKDKDMKD